MRTVTLETGSFIIRESIKELPINRYTDFQKYIIQDAGIGSTMRDVEEHFRMLDRFIALGQIEEAARERYNLHFNLYLGINKISIRHITFGCLIDSINDVKITDYSEANLQNVCDQLGAMGLIEEQVADILEEVKKKSILN